MKHNYNNSINLEELEGKELQTGKIVVGKVEDYVQKEIINLGSGDYSGVILTTMIYAFVAVFFTSKFFLSNYIMILRNTEYSMVRKSILHTHSK